MGTVPSVITIMRQVRKLVHNEAGQLSEHLRRLGLLNTEDLDTYTLRQLFVDAVLAHDCSIQTSSKVPGQILKGKPASLA